METQDTQIAGTTDSLNEADALTLTGDERSGLAGAAAHAAEVVESARHR